MMMPAISSPDMTPTIMWMHILGHYRGRFIAIPREEGLYVREPSGILSALVLTKETAMAVDKLIMGRHAIGTGATMTPQMGLSAMAILSVLVEVLLLIRHFYLLGTAS